jgi:hypothetical protein
MLLEASAKKTCHAARASTMASAITNIEAKIAAINPTPSQLATTNPA